MAKKEYLVPRETKTKMEVFPGFGLVELGSVVVGMAAGAILQLIPALLPLPMGPKIFARFFLFALPVGMVYMLFKQDVAGNTLYKQIQAFKAWSNKPKTYYYTRMRRGSN